MGFSSPVCRCAHHYGFTFYPHTEASLTFIVPVTSLLGLRHNANWALPLHVPYTPQMPPALFICDQSANF